jgi:glycosyltransferase involved in cell wall biosynthesis
MNSSLSGSASAEYGAIAIVGPKPPPLGGMALQALALHQHLVKESIPNRFIATNPELPGILARLKGVRTLIQSVIYVIELFRALPRVSVVHVLGASYFYFFSRVAPAIVIGRIMGKRVVLNYRGGAGPSFFARFGWVASPIVRIADLVTVPSAYLERCFAARKIACRVVPNLIDLQRFKYRRRELGSARLLVNRNLEPMYNVGMALCSFQIIKKQFPDACLDVVGSGSQEDSLKRWVAEQRLTGVAFHGAIAPERMPEFLDQADVLLNPTRVDNLPISLLEAFASGLPVVTTNVGGIPDLIGETKAALLVDPDDHKQMAGEIRRLLSDSGLAAGLTERGRALAEKFTWPSVRKCLFDSYYPSHAVTLVGAGVEERK